jgi:metallo-beta-lactamase family protein
MSHGGRIRRHEKRYLPDRNSTLLLVGYQVAGSLGRRIRDGAKKVEIDGVEIPVKANILIADGFSAHADRDDLLQFVEEVKPKRVFVVLGETEAATFLAQRISGFLNIPVDVPREGETYNL